MSDNKTGIRNANVKADMDLSKTLLKMIAIGFAGGAALIGSAKAFGDFFEEKLKEFGGDKK